MDNKLIMKMLSASMESLLQKMGKDEPDQGVIHEYYVMITAVYRELVASHPTLQATPLEFKLLLDYLVVLESIAGKVVLTTAEQQEREHLSTLLLNKVVPFPITPTEKNQVIFQELTGCSAIASPLGELAERLNRLSLLHKISSIMDVDEQKYLRQIENQIIDQLVICMHQIVHNQTLDARQKEELLAKALANKKIRQRFDRAEEKSVAQQKNEIQALISVLEQTVSKPLSTDELKQTVTTLETLLTAAHEKAGTESWAIPEIATLLHAAGTVYMQLGETEKALHRVEQAAEGGNSMARYYLVSCYKQGKYPYVDLNKLIMWCEECYLDTNLGLPAFNNIIEALDQIAESDDSDRVMHLLKSVKAKSKLLSIKNAIHSKMTGHKMSLFNKEHKEPISENIHKIMSLIREAEKKNTWPQTVPLVTALLDEGNKKNKPAFAEHTPPKHYSSLYKKIEKKPTLSANDPHIIIMKQKIK